MNRLKGPHLTIISRHSCLRSVYKISFRFFVTPPKELGKCTFAEEEFRLQKQGKPVDHHPYRTNSRAQEVFDKCIESMKSDGAIEKSPCAWGSPVFIAAKADGSSRFGVDYRNTYNKLLVRET